MVAVGPVAKMVGRQPVHQLADIGAEGVDRDLDRRGWDCHSMLEPHFADTCFVIGPKAVHTLVAQVVGGIRLAPALDGMWLVAWHHDDKFGDHQRLADTLGVHMAASSRDSYWAGILDLNCFRKNKRSMDDNLSMD